MAKIIFSEAAACDLEEIGDYIANQLQNPIAALRITNKIVDKIEKLSKSPFIGVPLSAKYSDIGDYRFLICSNYLAFYRTEGDEVSIDRILYGRRDYLPILLESD